MRSCLQFSLLTRVALLTLLTQLVCVELLAQDSNTQVEPPRRNAKKGDFARFPLGPLGGRGEVLADRAAIEVLEVREGAPAHRDGLRVGDHILGVGARAFPEHTRDINDLVGPQRSLGTAILRAETTGSRLSLRVLRKGEEHRVRIELPKFGRSDPTVHGDAQTLSFYDGICADLLRSRRPNGSWRAKTGKDASRYVTALCGLALLGRGQAEHRDALAKIAQYLAGPERRGYVSEDGMQPAGLSNWFISMSGIYLAEYVLATGDEQWLSTIQHLCDCLAKRQTPEGRYGHGIKVGYGGKGFNIINTHAHLLWALAERAGCKIDSRAWTRSLREIVKSTGKNGGVRYWTTQTGYWDGAARTGQMALALSLRDERPKLRARMAGYLHQHRNRMREAHAMGSIGMIFGTAALRRLNPKGWREHMRTWGWYLALMRQPNASAEYVGGKRNNGGDSYLGLEHVANGIAGVMLATNLGHLHICGNDRLGWLAGPR